MAAAIATGAIAWGVMDPIAVLAAPATLSPDGVFRDQEWQVDVRFSGGTHTYAGRNLRSGNAIALAGATMRQDVGTVMYRWNNNGTIYEVEWEPSDPNVIRLIVMVNGAIALDRLLFRI